MHFKTVKIPIPQRRDEKPKTPLSLGFAGVLLAGFALLSTTIPSPTASFAQEDQTSQQQTEPTPLQQAIIELRVNPKEAARLLKGIDPRTLPANQVARYYLSASRAALRTGDRVWLETISEEKTTLQESADNILILAAMRSLLAGDFKQARRILGQVPHIDQLEETPRRRYLQLSQRLEEIDNRPQAERAYADQLVTFVAAWPEEGCQKCHANPRKHGAEITTLDLKNLWFGQRYSILLQKMGDAKAVREKAIEELAQDKENEAARIKLAYALRALGDEKGSDEELRKIPWSQWPDREVKAPLQFAQFP